MELTPAELSYVRSQGLHLTCRLPGFVTILAAINDKARHHSKQDPTCHNSCWESVCGGQEDRLRLQCGRF